MSTAEDDIYSPARDYTSSQVLLGTVGWAGRSEHYELGSATNGGNTLVMVTLYGPRTPGVAPLKGVAQGHEILCHVADGVFRIPPKGARAYVIIPAGMEQVDGAGVIVATVNPGLELKSNPTDGETVITAMGGGQARVILKKDGSITLYTTNDNSPTGKGVSLRISPTEFAFYAPWGKLVIDATGAFLASSTGGRLTLSAIGGIPVLGALGMQSVATLSADMVSCRGSLVKLGSGTYMTVLMGVTGLAGTPSPQVMVGTGA